MTQTQTKSGKRPDLGFHVRSSTEADFFRYLVHVEKVEFEYEKTELWFDGIKRGTVSYLIDAEVPAWDALIEVKGYLDAKSLVKLKRTRIYHPEVFQRLWLVKQGFSAKDAQKLEKVGFPLDRVIDTAYLYAHSDKMPQWESRKPSKKAIAAAEAAGCPLISQIVQNRSTIDPSTDVITRNPVSKEQKCHDKRKQRRKPVPKPPQSSKTKSSTMSTKKSNGTTQKPLKKTTTTLNTTSPSTANLNTRTIPKRKKPTKSIPKKNTKRVMKKGATNSSEKG